jgi:hypothetical protein
MSDTSPYGVTQNADEAMVTANELVGERAGSIRENAMFGSAAAFSTAPYIPPHYSGCHGKNSTCQAYPIRGTQWCIFHTPKDPGEPPTAP